MRAHTQTPYILKKTLMNETNFQSVCDARCDVFRIKNWVEQNVSFHLLHTVYTHHITQCRTDGINTNNLATVVVSCAFIDE